MKEPKSRDIEKAARQYAAEILGFGPSQILSDDIGMTSFVAGVEWYKSEISRVSGETPKPDQWKEVATKQKELLDQITRTFTAWKPETVQRFQNLHIMFVKASEKVGGEAKTPDLDMAVYWRREYFKAHICEEELTVNYFEALVLLNEAMDAQMNSNLPARIKMFLDGETETKAKYSKLTGGAVPDPINKAKIQNESWQLDPNCEGSYAFNTINRIASLEDALKNLVDATEDKNGQFSAWHKNLREMTKAAKTLL